MRPCAAARRARTPVVDTDAFTVDLAATRVVRDGGDVRLTPTEWHLLEVLVRNSGRLVTQRQLLHEVWGPAYGRETNYLRVYLAQLRRKLEPDPARPAAPAHRAGHGLPLRAVIRLPLLRRCRGAVVVPELLGTNDYWALDHLGGDHLVFEHVFDSGCRRGVDAACPGARPSRVRRCSPRWPALDVAGPVGR